MTFKVDNQAHSTIFGYLGFSNYGDELLASCLIKKYDLENYKFLSKKNSLLDHLKAFFLTKQVFVIGGLFQDQTSFFSLFYYCFLIRLFNIFGKKIYLEAVGVGPILRESSRFVLFNCLKQIRNISVRDEYSREILSSVGIEARLEKDLAWTCDEIEARGQRTDKVLISVRNYNDWILVKERFEFKEFDLLIMQKEFDLAEQIQFETESGVDILDPFAFHYDELLKKISSYRKLITARYHAGILGYLAKTKVEILEISPKLSSLHHTQLAP